jgi:RND family efflux transporter MFP subunit
MNRRKILLPALVLVGAAIGAFLLIATAPEVESVALEKRLPIVRTIDVRPGDVRMLVRSQGTVAPRTESELVPEVSGRVEWVSPALVSGGFFSLGDPLLRIDARDYVAAIGRARAEVARAEGEAEHARAELRRQQGLARANANSPSQLSNTERGERVAVAALEAAQVSLEQAERDLARTHIDAPFDGRVRVERVDVGQFVSRGASIATLYATDYAEIRLPIADRQLAYLDLPGISDTLDANMGPRVVLRARFAGADRVWTGRIVRTEGEIDAQSRMVHVVARIEDPYGTSGAADNALADREAGGSVETSDAEVAEVEADTAQVTPLAVGMFVRAEIEGRLASGVLVVPRAAMRDGDRLLVVDADDRLHHRAVEVLRIDRDEVLLRAELADTERIVVSRMQVVVDGMKVRPIPAETESLS